MAEDISIQPATSATTTPSYSAGNEQETNGNLGKCDESVDIYDETVNNVHRKNGIYDHNLFFI